MKILKTNSDKNIYFLNNVKQLLPNLNVFDMILKDEPTKNENVIWKKHLGFNQDFITSGSLKNNDSVFYRSCYMFNRSTPLSDADHENIKVKITVKNIHTTEVDNNFSNYALVQVDASTYLFFVWIDLEQEYEFRIDNINGTNIFGPDDWAIQVVI